MFFSLPDDEVDSEAEQDEGAAEELAESTVTEMSIASSVENTSTEDTVVQEPTTNSASFSHLELPDLNTPEVMDDEGWDENVGECFKTTFSEKTPEIKQPFAHTAAEIDYFKSLLSRDIINNIVIQTNLYANQERVDPRTKASKKTKNWTDTSAEEIEAFIGMLIIMGIHRLPHVSNYWSSDPILGVESVSKVMPLKRFKKLVENIHLNDNSTAIPKGQDGYDKLHKLRPLIMSLNENCSTEYEHSNMLSVDESMIPFKGRSSIKQYMPMKPIKRGYKVWCLADSKTGFVLRFSVYCGKSHSRPDGQTLGESVVLDLCKSLAGKQSLVAFDNFFTTYGLMNILAHNSVFSVGTVRANRKGLPEMMSKKSKLERGEFMYGVKGSVAAIKWQDSKEVTILTSAVSPREVTFVIRKQKDGSNITVPCPEGVTLYNKTMGGVDHFDQLQERYSLGRRSLKWWHRILYYFLDMAIVNSYTMMKIARGDREQLQFRIRLARQLINGYTSKKRRGRCPLFISKNKDISVPLEVRTANVGVHLPRNTGKFRRCRLCSTKKIEKRSRFECTSCQVSLCMEPCFRLFHQK